MSFGVGGAILGSALIGGIASNKAAKENTKGINKGLDQSAAISKQARDDVVALFDSSAKRANVGIQEALNFYKQNAQKRMQPYAQANQAARNVIGQGAIQANNAILGLPVDMNQITKAQVQPQADYSGIMAAQVPVQESNYEKTLGQNQIQEAQPSSGGSGGIPGGIAGKLASKSGVGKVLSKLF